jgi:putative addiction module component (TIGR02574 family)
VSPDLKQCEASALKLPLKERATLAERLISSLDSPEGPEIDRQWIEEAERRYKAYRKGSIKARMATAVLREARAALK